jgi:uncharacterized membrane protein
MRKSEFLEKLDRALSPLAQEERREILSDFAEHFSNGEASGKTEEEVAKELGDPVVLAAQYTEGLPPPPPSAEKRAAGIAQGVLAGFGLLFFDLMIAIPVIATLFSVWLTLWSMVLVLFCVALVCFVAPFLAVLVIPSALASIGLFIIGIAMLALTVLAGIGMCYVSKWSFKGLVGFVNAHIRIIKGGSKA